MAAPRPKQLCFTLLLLLLVSIQLCSQLALSHSLVKFLPGFQGPLPFELETGYVGVDESEDVQIFYYFVKSETKPRQDPLILWLTGGPCCSSFSGLIYEIGPLYFKEVRYNGSLPTLELNSNSWTKMANIIFVDLPVGTGFSYARTSRAAPSFDLQLCDQAHHFLRKWLNAHPEYISNPLYVGGDSYSGITVPIVAQVISNGNEGGTEQFNINLKGYILGNPLTFPDEDNYRIQFSHGMGLISDELYECTGTLNQAHILEINCGLDYSPKPLKLFNGRRSLDERFQELHTHKTSPLSAFYCRVDGYWLSYHWMNDESVREALHVRKGSKGTWIRCNQGLPYESVILDSRPYHVNLSRKGYRSLIYSGDHDMLVPFPSTQAWIRHLNYSIVDEWRPWNVHGQIAGYTRTYSNQMTFATVKGGGHTAPEFKPEECYAMFKRWISYEPL
ncbi:hypothetical protein RJ640_006854 [Escallonia rubra]|uniref:Uncharacterized protein n=1 Tax=Escallonia rubra TaxID=112253 RepID=A0AA88UKF7_9ASTE|nr:hypothetical protein RJ640_006854 [Escallonia rubra]